MMKISSNFTVFFDPLFPQFTFNLRNIQIIAFKCNENWIFVIKVIENYYNCCTCSTAVYHKRPVFPDNPKNASPVGVSHIMDFWIEVKDNNINNCIRYHKIEVCCEHWYMRFITRNYSNLFMIVLCEVLFLWKWNNVGNCGTTKCMKLYNTPVPWLLV